MNRTVTNNCLTRITYVKGNATQLKRMVSKSDYEVIRAARDHHAMLTSKLQKEFEKTHKIKLNPDEVVEDSPLGLAIMGKMVLQVGMMILPECQGGEHLVVINDIYESEEINTLPLQD